MIGIIAEAETLMLACHQPQEVGVVAGCADGGVMISIWELAVAYMRPSMPSSIVFEDLPPKSTPNKYCITNSSFAKSSARNHAHAVGDDCDGRGFVQQRRRVGERRVHVG